MSYISHYPGIDKIAWEQELEEYVNKKVTVDDSITIITVATDDIVDQAYNIRQLKKSGVKYINAEDFREDKSTPFTMPTKISDFVAALKTVDTPYVVLMDATDAVLTENLDKGFIDIFLSFDKDLVYNCSPTRFPKNEYYVKEPALCTHFLNAGVCVGKTEETLIFYEEALELSKDGLSDSEQHYIKMLRDNHDNVEIDTDRLLFQCHKRDFNKIDLTFMESEYRNLIRVLYSTDIDYYKVLFEYLSNFDISVDDRVSVILLNEEGYLVDQLTKNKIDYSVVGDPTTYSSILMAVNSINTPYVLIIDPRYSILANDIDSELIDIFEEKSMPVLFGTLTSRSDVTDAERSKADDHYINKFLNKDTIFGKTEQIKELLEEAAEEIDNTSYPILRDIWLRRDDLATDGRQLIFFCCYFNDADVSKKSSMHAPFSWRKREDGWHYLE